MMCGRFGNADPRRAIEQMQTIIGARVDAAASIDLLYTPRWNIAPTQPIVAVTWHDGPLVTLARWGLARRGGGLRINVRRESLFGGRDVSLLERGRCLVLADAFYEWRGGAPVKFSPGVPFAFAGLAEAYDGALTAAIVTREPVALVAPVHDRMPYVLAPDDIQRWLDPTADAAAERDLLAMPPDLAGWTATDVSPRLNSVANDDAACWEPPPRPVQRSLF